MRRTVVLALVAALSPGLAAAQALTDDQLLGLFQKQRDAFKAAKDSGVGQTRGLTLVTVDEQKPAQETTTTTAATEVQPTVFGKLAPEMQVNVQITFEFDSAALGNDQKPKLAQLCKVMKESDIQLFRIVGHTDAAGSDDYNERLSKLRAQEVQRFFVDDCGIAATRLEAVGVGEKFLFNSSDPRSGENRRVEFQALS